MTQVLKPQIEAISYHEGAPGHHFQSALAQELPNVPKFRRFGGYTAYGEGWGLYAEQLGKEMGFYQDPYSDFGRLSTELWRAIRLVVDTGIHHKEWTREQAIEYFARTACCRASTRPRRSSAISTIRAGDQLHDRPAQDFRAAPPRAAGAGRPLRHRDFHAVVLENGPLPLDVLEELVDRYIATTRISG
jgi:uncharacterized protein (DUF885 family)